jgi:hypothetical protein
LDSHKKRQINGKTLTTSQIVQEPNLDKILQSHIGFRDLERLRTSPDYIQGLRKKLFAMIRQLGPFTFFITLTSAERLWTPLLKALYELNAYALKLPDFSSLEGTHIA